MGQFMVGTGSSFPFSVASMALFIAYLSERGYKYNSIRTYCSAVSFFHKIQVQSDPSGSYLVVKTLEGVRKMQPASEVRLPITLELLCRLVGTLPRLGLSHYDSLLFKAMFTTAFFGLLRVGEIAYTSSTQSHTLQFENVLTSGPPVRYTLILKSFKFSQGGEARIRLQRNSTGACPVQHLGNYLAVRSLQPGPLFCLPDNTPVTRTRFTGVLSKVIKSLGLDTQIYKSHSFRIGGATYAAQLGFSDAEIRQLGRWRSNAFKKYIRY